MKKNAYCIIVLLLVSGILLNSGCKKKFDTNIKLTLKLLPALEQTELQNIQYQAGFKENVDKTIEILNKRLLGFGCNEVSINKTDNDSIIEIDIKGVPDAERAKDIIKTTGYLAFWETYDLAEIYPYLDQANKALVPLYKDSLPAPEKEDSTKAKPVDVSELGYQSDSKPDSEFISQNPLFSCLYPNIVQNENGQAYPQQGAIVGSANVADTARINTMLNLKEVTMLFPRDLYFMWTMKAVDEEGKFFQLVAIRRRSRDLKPPITGEYIVEARAEKDPSGRFEVFMEMNTEGARIWKKLTGDNLSKAIAITIDKAVYTAPIVQAAIESGRSSITGNFTQEEASDLAVLIKNGALLLNVSIIKEELNKK